MDGQIDQFTDHTKRFLLKVLLGSGLSGVLFSSKIKEASAGNASVSGVCANLSVQDIQPKAAHYISGARKGDEEYVAVVFDQNGEVISTIAMPARVHGMAVDQSRGNVAIFTRRPGLSLVTFSSANTGKHKIINALENRRFYGHGTYSERGKLLFATENDFDNARGVLGVYDATKEYQRVGDIDSGGVGPHEVVRIPHSNFLLIANGGVQTHPASGREKLNVATMESSLTIVNASSAKVVARCFLPEQVYQLSIRHVACAEDGTAWFAGQYEGDNGAKVPLIGVLSIGSSMESYSNGVSRRGLDLIKLPEQLRASTRNYLSSVSISGAYVFFTAAHGGIAFCIDRYTHLIVHSLSILDCSGVAGAPVNGKGTCASAVITTGTGEILSMNEQGALPLVVHQLQWDNHVYRL